jgi:hypothetical protein
MPKETPKESERRQKMPKDAKRCQKMPKADRATKDETSKDGQEMLSQLHLTISPENSCNLRGLAALDGK